MSALFYRLLGQAVWKAALMYLRRKNGRLLLPPKVVGAAVVLIALAVAGAGARRAGGPSGQLRA
jgi:xanthine/uracil permease